MEGRWSLNKLKKISRASYSNSQVTFSFPTQTPTVVLLKLVFFFSSNGSLDSIATEDIF